MSTLIERQSNAQRLVPGVLGWATGDDRSPVFKPRHSIRALLLPLFEQVAESSSNWRAESVGFWRTPEGRYWMPRLVFSRPSESRPSSSQSLPAFTETKPAWVHALCDLVRSLEAVPALARQYEIHLYPLCNPTGYEDGTRYSRSGKDLNREFWRGSAEPEVELIERELVKHRYDGLIALHCDDTSEGLYGFVRGATLTAHLLKPALAAAEQLLPVNDAPTIDGFHAINGIIHTAYNGILSAPPDAKPAPFEIILESPAHAPLALQRAAQLLAVTEIIRHYRRLLAYAADL
jgi:hypothetical protein